jgi:hypothetical protein
MYEMDANEPNKGRTPAGGRKRPADEGASEGQLATARKSAAASELGEGHCAPMEGVEEDRYENNLAMRPVLCCDGV